ACTGVHGANRLASNSLLEGLVFGARAGKKAADYIEQGNAPEPVKIKRTSKNAISPAAIDAEKIRSSLRQLMWKKVGIIRCEKSLTAARNWLKKWKEIMDMPFRSRRESELRNMLTVSHMITEAALLRQGSVGAHYRSDFKQRGEQWERHTAFDKGKHPHWIK
ncbi:MAG: L-aspartate oxidase, partial [Nitrospirota bacterium]